VPQLPFAADGFKHCLKYNHRILEDVTDKGGNEEERVSVNSFGANLPTMEPGVFGLGIAKKALFDNWFRLHKTGTYIVNLCKTDPQKVSKFFCDLYKDVQVALFSPTMFDEIQVAMHGSPSNIFDDAVIGGERTSAVV
jgi:hypothetical protein